MSFAEKIIALLNEKNIAQSKMLSDLNLGKNQLAYWKKNGNIPKWDTVENIAKYLGVSADYLLGNEQKKSTPTDSADAEADRLFEQVKQLPLEKQQQAFDYLRFLLGQQDKH
ncbi:Uncharacterised protein [uncultured Ruminococcus sp.]|nr:Uncharacterised protein [uncultured Clostridium sp.]SCH77418.1 Uncharacterised protein [uncultured Ruminococcus sp.]